MAAAQGREVSPDRIPLLVLGLGNVLCGDDGAGVCAVEHLTARWNFPDGVRILDGGTLGLSLLPYLRAADRAILVDAVLVDEPPGSIVRFDGEEVFAVAGARMSCHQIGVAEVLECARLLGDLPETTLVGIAAQDVGAMARPTRAVSDRIDDLVACVVEEIRAMGFQAKPSGRQTEDSPHGGGVADPACDVPGRAGFRDRL
jgi:hydrogenase maturation protease